MPFRASVRRAGKQVHLGYFATAEEAALTYARTPEAKEEAANPDPALSVPLIAETAAAQATVEGPKPSNNAGGKGGAMGNSNRGGATMDAAEPLLAFIGLAVHKTFKGTPARTYGKA